MRCRECENRETHDGIYNPATCKLTGLRVEECGQTPNYRKTSPRWCPRRKCNQQHMVVVARDSIDAKKEG